jgi:hypothetical protein
VKSLDSFECQCTPKMGPLHVQLRVLALYLLTHPAHRTSGVLLFKNGSLPPD